MRLPPGFNAAVHVADAGNRRSGPASTITPPPVYAAYRDAVAELLTGMTDV